MSYEAFRLMVQGWASSGYLPEALAYGFVSMPCSPVC